MTSLSVTTQIAAMAVALPPHMLSRLNPEQLDAVQSAHGPVLLAAVAGAGKTHALVSRIANLVANGVSPTRILAVTFSKKGADEMNERLSKVLGKDCGARVGTFHSLALQICKSEAADLTDFTIDDKDRYHYCIKDAIGFRGMDWKQADVTIITSYIAFCKANGFRPHTQGAKDIAEIYYRRHGFKANPRSLNEAYARTDLLAIERKLLTFDEMLLRAVELLRDDSIRTRWASRWDFVMQDEAQDQNACQLDMGELLARDHRNYLLVGDSAQTIYTWRGAQPDKLLGFESRWGAKVIRMARNYRCGKLIIAVANKVLNAMNPATRLDMDMIAEAPFDGVIETAIHTNLDEEAQSITAKIQAHLASGMEPRDVVVLYRTNAQSRAPEEALIGARIPYRVLGATNFYERKEVKDLLAYLRLAEGRGDIEDVERCINAPFRFLGKAFVDKVRETAKAARAAAKRNGGKISWPAIIRRVCDEQRVQYRQRQSAEDWADLIEEMQRTIANTSAQGDVERMPARILENIVQATNYTAWLTKDEGEESPENSRVSNIREMIRAAGRFQTATELLNYVEQVIASSRKERQSDEEPNKVTLCSIHRSKGAEYPAVFVIGCAEGILPHAKCEDMEEERRLFYVAVTRAKKYLSVTTPTEIAIGTKVKMVEPSRFMAEGGLIDDEGNVL